MPDKLKETDAVLTAGFTPKSKEKTAKDKGKKAKQDGREEKSGLGGLHTKGK